MSLHHELKPTIVTVFLLLCLSFTVREGCAQRRQQAPEGGQRAVVVDERLAALRDAPELSAGLIQRMSRGRAVAVKGARRSSDGVTFYRVAVTRRTGGWVQSEAVVSTVRKDDDVRLLKLVEASDDFDRLVRARIFLDVFQRSPLRPTVLMLFGEAAERAAVRLSREAARRLDDKEMAAGGAPLFSYFLNYNGLDRYRRQGIVFLFDRASKQFHYDGAAWREVLRRHPHSPEAAEAQKRLDALNALAAR